MTDKKGTTFTRKRFFINRNIQGRYMVTFMVPMIIFLAFMLFTLYFASEAIINSTMRIVRSDMESTIAYTLQDQVEPGVEQYKALTNQLQEYVSSFSANNVFRRELLGSLMVVVTVGMVLIIAQIVLLTIFFSHKLAGPVYRFEKACKSIIDGDYTNEIKLRKGDQLKNLAELLNEAIRVTRERMLTLSSKDQDVKKDSTSELKL
ncbi:hypothetical protein QA601_02405 [Chitinispirillales bacterium ANBcel5]|uniref:hypothetical protein n=1 Tax=Cellulosispirillum alkaliphilum TaxID=3039283 RepID=UPI002A55B6FB|nr:hypothetical protein [Chitinispirillales bacterium ANBcel5]